MKRNKLQGNLKQKVTLQRDFMHPDVMIKDKLPEFAPSPNLKDRPNEVNVSTTSKPNDVTAVPPEEKFVIAGSNFEFIVPEIGVVVKEENKQKQGMGSYQSKFGKLSVKEFERIKKEYASKFENKHTSSSLSYWKQINEEFHPSNEENKKKETLKQTVIMPTEKIRTRSNLKEIFTKEESSSRNFETLPILNENIFKRRKTSDLRTDINNFKDIDQLNLKIIQNKNWGGDITNFSSSQISNKLSLRNFKNGNKLKKMDTRILRERTKKL